MRSIFQFRDHREFLKEFYEFQKRSRSGYSYRSFSDAAGIQSPNYLKLVIDGKRKLLSHNIFQFARAMNLGFSEGEYFEAMVNFTQSTSVDEKKYHSLRLKNLSANFGQQKVLSTQYAVLSAWYMPAVLVCLGEKDCTIELICNMTGITQETANNAVEHLLKLGVVEKNGDRFLVTGKHLDVRAKNGSNTIIDTFLQKQLERSLNAFQNRKKTNAKFFSHTFSIDSESYDLFIDHIRSFVDATAQKAQSLNTEKVVQLNIQYFPIKT